MNKEKIEFEGYNLAQHVNPEETDVFAISGPSLDRLMGQLKDVSDDKWCKNTRTNLQSLYTRKDLLAEMKNILDFEDTVDAYTSHKEKSLGRIQHDFAESHRDEEPRVIGHIDDLDEDVSSNEHLEH